jgi:hypothetical protein
MEIRIPPPRRARPRKRPATFSDVRRDAEKKLARGLELDFDQIMLDIAAIRRAGRLTKNQ